MSSTSSTPIQGATASRLVRWRIGVAVLVMGSTLLVFGLRSLPSYAATPAVGLGTAASYSVLGGQTVTNTGSTTLSHDLGVSPGTAITGFPPGTTAGATHAGDAEAAQAQSALTTAYNDAAGRAATATLPPDIVNQVFFDGVYNRAGALQNSGTVTLDGQGDPDAVFIFQVGSMLTTASASNVALINGAQACNVFWQIGSSATLGTNSTFRGTLMALTSISVNNGVAVQGRALARNGQVSLDANVFTSPFCAAAQPTTTTTAGVTTTTAAGATTTTTAAGATTTTTAAGVTTTTTAMAATTTTTALATTTTRPNAAAATTTTTRRTVPGLATGTGTPARPRTPGTTPLARTGPEGNLNVVLPVAGLFILLGMALLLSARSPQPQKRLRV